MNRIYLRFPDETEKNYIRLPAENNEPFYGKTIPLFSDTGEVLFIPRSGLGIPGFFLKPGMKNSCVSC